MIVGKSVKINVKGHNYDGHSGKVLAVTFKEKTMILFVQIGPNITDVEHKHVLVEDEAKR